MKALKIVTIVGARPQFIKAAAVSREVGKHPEIEEVIIHTGQHFDKNMSSIFFDEMDIPKPKYELNINSMSHGSMTGRMIEEIEKILIDEKPQWVMVYGDTNSTLAGALAAKKLHINVAHVEAGLRSFNLKMPEEINRILTDRISDVLFCASSAGLANLKNEGFDGYPCDVMFIGDVMFDAVNYYNNLLREKRVGHWTFMDSPFALATIHREENTNDNSVFRSIVEALNRIHEELVPVVIVLHPRTRKLLKSNNIKLKVHVIDPVGYFEMLNFINHSKFVITDSGGLQKEAYFLGKRGLIVRNETEWVELVESGNNLLAGNSNINRLISAATDILNSDLHVEKGNFYGDGTASEKIVEYFLKRSY